ncbi:conjugal transfer protein TrbL family protein [Staphylospora marina]|uniref:conjugal transfer protein TrbL family protein n=1 Tax=Staphylospora marina TaxID=2490858 RepID=UPI000F5C0497|nr:conjugal transfer protein TrbL family protein [Staphylospora marina]
MSRLRKWLLLFCMFAVLLIINPGVASAEEIDFKCGTFDPGCHIDQWLANIAVSTTKKGVEFIANLAKEPSKLLSNTKVREFKGYFEKAAWSFITVFFLFHLVRVLAMYWVDEDLVLFKRMLVKLIITVTMCTGYTWAMTEMTAVANDTMMGFAKLELSVTRTNLLLQVFKIQRGFVIILALIFAILLIIVAIQVAIRAAELAFLFISGPFAIATNLNENFNLFPAWWRSLLSILITQVFQIIMLSLTIQLFSDVRIDNDASLTNFIWGMGMMVLTLKSPSYLKELMYSTGAGQAVVGAAAKSGMEMGKAVLSRLMRK